MSHCTVFTLLSAGVSSTGTGETFMRAGVARRVGWLVEAGSTAQEAVTEALEFMQRKVGIQWNSEVMGWAWGREGSLHYGIKRGDDFVEEL